MRVSCADVVHFHIYVWQMAESKVVGKKFDSVTSQSIQSWMVGKSLTIYCIRQTLLPAKLSHYTVVHAVQYSIISNV